MKRMLLSFLLLIGCTTTTYKLDKKYRPLTEIVETSKYNITTDLSTLGTQCFTNNLSEFLKNVPPGSADFNALLLHEQYHALRQQEVGLNTWNKRYNDDFRFRRSEELGGYRIQIFALLDAGIKVDVKYYGDVLANNPAYRMIEQSDAEKWVQQTINEWAASKNK